MPNSDRSARSINLWLFLRKAGGVSNSMQTLQDLGLSTRTARNFLGPFSESARNFRLRILSGRVRTCKYWFFRRANMPNAKSETATVFLAVYTFLRIAWQPHS
jgi:hypothetical protein